MNGEIRTGIRPGGDRLPSRSARQCRKGIERIFVAVLGVDGFAGAEFDCLAGDSHPLAFAAGEMHFDPMALDVVEGLVAKGTQIEVGAELAVDASEQIQVELRGDALGVVVGGIEPRRVLDRKSVV